MTPVAIIQLKPIHNSLPQTLEIALSAMEQAAQNGAKLVVFGECWLCGYPGWIDCSPQVGNWDIPAVKEAWATMYNNSLEVPGKELQAIKKLAKEKQLNVVIGANEVVKNGKGNGTLYNAVLTIDENGVLCNHHRKLMPTYNEKLIHGTGDGHGLQSVDASIGRIGAMICWEHWMPLTRQAMHDAGEDIHIALWPSMQERHILASRQYAFEGRCYVISVGQVMTIEDIPEGLEVPKAQKSNKYLLNGGSCAFGPNAETILEPQYDKEEIIYFELPANEHLTKEKMNLAVSGHYQRPDVFDFTINRKRLTDE